MFDAGSTGFMLVCAMLVLLMTPGLAFFLRGLSRRKNVVNTMIMSLAVIGTSASLRDFGVWAGRFASAATARFRSSGPIRSARRGLVGRHRERGARR